MGQIRERSGTGTIMPDPRDARLVERIKGIGQTLPREVGLTLVGRARGKRFTAPSGKKRIVFDQDLATVEEEPARNTGKGAGHDD